MTGYLAMKRKGKLCNCCEHFSGMTDGQFGKCQRHPPKTNLWIKLWWNEKKTRIFPVVKFNDHCGEFTQDEDNDLRDLRERS